MEKEAGASCNLQPIPVIFLNFFLVFFNDFIYLYLFI